jgi:hypothetical protein
MRGMPSTLRAKQRSSVIADIRSEQRLVACVVLPPTDENRKSSARARGAQTLYRGWQSAGRRSKRSDSAIKPPVSTTRPARVACG